MCVKPVGDWDNFLTNSRQLSQIWQTTNYVLVRLLLTYTTLYYIQDKVDSFHRVCGGTYIECWVLAQIVIMSFDRWQYCWQICWLKSCWHIPFKDILVRQGRFLSPRGWRRCWLGQSFWQIPDNHFDKSQTTFTTQTHCLDVVRPVLYI